MIGYPGLDEVVVGGRGLWRASLAVHAPSGHSGSSKSVVGDISRVAHLVGLLDAADLPGVDGTSAFPLPPKLSVTSFHGGQGFSVTTDRVDINVDIRTTPALRGRRSGSGGGWRRPGVRLGGALRWRPGAAGGGR